MDRSALAVDLVLRGGEQIRASFGKVREIHAKKRQDFLTEVDIAIETLYRREISFAFPGDGLLGEEQGYREGTTGTTWIFDPLDGTNNFARGIPLNGTILAIRDGDQITEGYIYLPHSGELYSAKRGQGAYLQNMQTGEKTKLSVSVRPLEEYLVVADFWPDHTLYQEELPFWTALHTKTPNFRCLFCAAQYFSMIASGKAELTFGPENNLWDVAAGCLLVLEAGGMVTDYRGAATTNYAGPIVVSNGVAHDQVIRLIQKYYTTENFSV